MYWSPSSTGDWATDCETGRYYANNVIEYGEPEVLFKILRDMVQKGNFDGCAAGFVQRVSEVLTR